MREQALAQIEQIVAVSPEDTASQFELANTENRLSHSLIDARQGVEAGRHLARMVAILGELARADPKNALYERSLGVSQIDWGTALRVSGDPSGALAHDRKALDIAGHLHAADPANADFCSDIGIDNRRTAATLIDLNRPAEAEAKARLAQQALCVPSAPANTYLQAHCGRAWLADGNARFAMGLAVRARMADNVAVGCAQRTLLRDPANAIYRFDLARANAALAIVLAASGQSAAARQAFHEAERNWQALRATSALTAEDAARADQARRRFPSLFSRDNGAPTPG